MASDPDGNDQYQYGSAEQDEWHAYMDGAGTPDYGGRRNRAISSCMTYLAVCAVLFFALMMLRAFLLDASGEPSHRAPPPSAAPP
jgi:hypothetical protein